MKIEDANVDALRTIPVPAGLTATIWSRHSVRRRTQSRAITMGAAIVIALTVWGTFLPRSVAALNVQDVRDALLHAKSVRWIEHWHGRIMKFEPLTLQDHPYDRLDEHIFVASPAAHWQRDLVSKGPWFHETNFPYSMPIKRKDGHVDHLDSYGVKRVAFNQPAYLDQRYVRVLLGNFWSSNSFIAHAGNSNRPAEAISYRGSPALRVTWSDDTEEGWKASNTIVADATSKRLLLWEARITSESGELLYLRSLDDIRYDVERPSRP